MRVLLSLVSVFCVLMTVSAQQVSKPGQFLKAFSPHEGKYYEGKIIAGGQEGDGFTGQRLLMHVMEWGEDEVKVPFYVGENKSRTWIFKLKDGRIELKHDHRQSDGSPDAVTMYGGTASTEGTADKQMFPADPYTCQLIDYACFNVWWVTIEGDTFTYNLRRIGTDRLFSVSFDLTKPVTSDYRPW